jgi:hypothetical protein
MKMKKTVIFIIVLWAFCVLSGEFVLANPVLTNEKSFVKSPIQIGVDETTDPVFIAKYEQVAQNDNLIMFADKEKGLFAIEDVHSGKIWYSTPNNSLLDKKTKGKQKMDLQSQLIIEYIYCDDENTNKIVQTANSQSGCINKNGIKVTALNNGIRVEYNFADLGMVIPVDYTIEKDYLQANIDFEKLQEGNKCFLISINLLPTIGAGSWDDEGYLFVPDGCGALVKFNNNINTMNQYQSPVYGADLSIVTTQRAKRNEIIRLPVFGTVSGNNALMGVITSGDSAASIVVYNGNSLTGYNAISSKAVLKIQSIVKSLYTTNHMKDILQISHTPYGLKNYQVRYYHLNDENASYVGMAKRYRQYLTEEKNLEKNPQPPSFSLDIYGAITVKSSFLGIPYDKKCALTTFSQTQKILEDLKSNGIENIALRYLGWSNNGVINKIIPKKASTLNSLGNKKSFDSLKNYTKENNIAFYPAVDFIQYQKGGNNVDARKDSAKTTNGDVALQHEYLLSIHITKLNESPLRLLAPKNLLKIASSYEKSYQNLGIDSICLDNLGDMMYSDFQKNTGTYRSQTAGFYDVVMKLYKQNNYQLAFSGGNAYTMPYAQRIYSSPVYSSGYDIFSYDVPFYQLVFHGYVSLTVPEMIQSIQPEVTYLKAVETGSELLYAGINQSAEVLSSSRFDYLYSSTYSMWAKNAIDYYKKYSGFLKKVYDKPIKVHKQIAKDVFMTTFENDISVIVNYSVDTVEYKGYQIQGMDFLELEGK